VLFALIYLPLRLRRLQERPRTPRRPANAKTEHTPQLPPKLALAAGTRAFRVGIQLMRSQVQHRHLRLYLLLSPGPVPLHPCHLNRNLLQVPTMLLKAGAPAWSGLTFRRRCITAQRMSFMARRRMENIWLKQRQRRWGHAPTTTNPAPEGERVIWDCVPDLEASSTPTESLSGLRVNWLAPCRCRFWITCGFGDAPKRDRAEESWKGTYSDAQPKSKALSSS
jgi:hypothetical protein